ITCAASKKSTIYAAKLKMQRTRSKTAATREVAEVPADQMTVAAPIPTRKSFNLPNETSIGETLQPGLLISGRFRADNRWAPQPISSQPIQMATKVFST